MPNKRANNEGSIRQRPDGRWEARFTVGRDPGTGKQVRKSIYGDTQEEVRKALQKACTEVDEGTYMEPSKITAGQWFDMWKDEYLGGVKSATVVSYSQHIKNHLKPAFGSVKLLALTTPMIQKLYNTMQKEGRSPKTIKNLHGVVHSSLKQAVRLGYIRVNPSDNCILPRIEKAAIQPLDSPEMDRFLKVIKDSPYEALFKVDMFTGMRQGELLGLTWDCVDFEQGRIMLTKQLCRPRVKGEKHHYGTLKNDKPRVITPASYVMDVLKAHRRAQAAMRLKAGAAWNEGDFPGLVFTNEIGGHLSYAVVYSHFRKNLAKAGIEPKRFHDLRHTYAVSSLRSGDDIKTVQENLGHHTAAFTLDQYGHVTDTMKKESAKRMDAFINGLENSK